MLCRRIFIWARLVKTERHDLPRKIGDFFLFAVGLGLGIHTLNLRSGLAHAALGNPTHCLEGIMYDGYGIVTDLI